MGTLAIMLLFTFRFYVVFFSCQTVVLFIIPQMSLAPVMADISSSTHLTFTSISSKDDGWTAGPHTYMSELKTLQYI